MIDPLECAVEEVNVFLLAPECHIFKITHHERNALCLPLVEIDLCIPFRYIGNDEMFCVVVYGTVKVVCHLVEVEGSFLCMLNGGFSKKLNVSFGIL